MGRWVLRSAPCHPSARRPGASRWSGAGYLLADLPLCIFDAEMKWSLLSAPPRVLHAERLVVPLQRQGRHDV